MNSTQLSVKEEKALAVATVGASLFLAHKLLKNSSRTYDYATFKSGLYFRAFVSLITETKLYRAIENVIDKAPRAGEEHVDPRWLTRILRAKNYISDYTYVTKVEFEPLTHNRGLASYITVMKMTYYPEERQGEEIRPQTLLFKSNSRPSAMSHRLNLLSSYPARESEFLATFGEKIFPEFVPKILYTSSNWFRGEYVVIMEDLRSSATGVNFYFGMFNFV